jgi:excisionase family DNA binding protein
VLTADEVADWLGHSPAYVRHEAAAGRLPALKAGRRWRFVRDELLALRR